MSKQMVKVAHTIFLLSVLGKHGDFAYGELEWLLLFESMNCNKQVTNGVFYCLPIVVFFQHKKIWHLEGER
jgi:hypothetical protein